MLVYDKNLNDISIKSNVSVIGLKSLIKKKCKLYQVGVNSRNLLTINDETKSEDLESFLIRRSVQNLTLANYFFWCV